MNDKHEPDLTPAGERTTARGLIRAARHATLATADAGQPYAALVTPAATPGLDLLLLLSGLSRHTAHLRADPRCALLCAADPPRLANPQTIERIGLTCHATEEPHPAARALYLATHPYAAFYASLPDFTVWRLAIDRADYVGGFARAHRFTGAELRPTPDLAAEMAASNASVVEHCNTDHTAAMAALGHTRTGLQAPWRLAGIDADGCTLCCDTASTWIAWNVPVRTSADLRHAMVALVRPT